MVGRACTMNPFEPGNASPTLAEVEARPKRNWATIGPFIPPNKTPPRVTERDRTSIDTAMASGSVPVRRFNSRGEEVA